MSGEQQGFSALDQAHGLRLAGEHEQALRLAASVLTAVPEDVGAAALIGRLLLEADRAAVAAEIATRAVDAFVRRGDLAGARVAAELATDAGAGQGTLERIASAFGKGSQRISAAAAKPPLMPTEVEIAPHFAKLSGDALLDAADKAARRFLATKDAVPADAPLPELPLFGTLEPQRLQLLLGQMELRELSAGKYALKQGERGREAFVLARGVINVVREDATGKPTLLATLGPGSIFGEMALVTDAPRAASAVAVEPVQLLTVTQAALESLARQDPAIGSELGAFCYGRMISNLIRHSAILSSVEPGRRSELVARFKSERFEAGDCLVRRGEEPSCLYLLASGGVQVRGTDADGDRVVLAELGPGDVVGEISLVLRRPAIADVVALHTTVALALGREQFSEAIREHPALLRELYDMAVQRDEETRSVVAQKALDVSDVVLL
ncbi:MAG: cyclic nucleotide-binding domain-containing protein [Polyangiales bacterium]